MNAQYNPQEVEHSAQQHWQRNQTFVVTEEPDREKFYCLSMFPYPSGRLHMGHVRNYTIGDVISRYQRMCGKHVLQPMGWDAFGMPAENAAIKHGVAPAKWTYENIDYMRGQLQRLGFAYDWSREITTCKPEYYHWEQWLFTRLYEKGLVYKKTAPVNWCPNDMTVLANEQVKDGRCWRCNTTVERKQISQWFMKITDYAEELLADIDKLDGWPESVKTMQRHWIGRSEGVELEFAVPGAEPLQVYTTRPDTLMGVTYVAVAAQHPLALQAAAGNPALRRFIDECEKQTTAEAALETMEKKGMPIGIDAAHPVTGEAVPVWAANFVLMGYGTGAVMSVPAHDQRDYEFAVKYDLPIKQVIFAAGTGETADVSSQAYTEKGVLGDSGQFDGLTSEAAFDAIADWLEQHGKGRRRTHYRLRDWGVSRQRYWGAPIPIVHCPQCGMLPVPEDQLPVVLPEDVEFDGVGSPIKKMPEFYQTRCPQCGGAAERETDTFDTFFESSWYYARYACPQLPDAMLDRRADYWLPVDQYIGGIEHAVMHLLYARFFHKLMRDSGLVEGDEPFTRLLTQGMVVAETYQREQDGETVYVAPSEVSVERDDKGRIVSARMKQDGSPVRLGGIEKMSKSKNNGVDPQALIDQYGADTVRLFTMFAAPPTQSLEWNDDAVEGAYRFLRRLWRLVMSPQNLSVLQAWFAGGQAPGYDWQDLPAELSRVRSEIHGLLQQVNRDVDKYQFNTVVAAGMKMLNLLSPLANASERNTGQDPQQQAASAVLAEGTDILLRILYPIVPHITHALWVALARPGEIVDASWPAPDPRALAVERLSMPVMVNGKRRGSIEVMQAWDAAQIEQTALNEPNVKRHLEALTVRKVVIVPKKLVNIVAN